MTFGNDASLKEGSVPESKNNRCIESSHHHGGVREVGMLRSVIEKSREILADAKINEAIKVTGNPSCRNSKGALVSEEVGVVRSSDEVSVMENGAKGPYLYCCAVS